MSATIGYVELEREPDGRRVRIRADAIECVLEDERALKDGSIVSAVTVQLRTLNVKAINETLESLWAKIRAATSQTVIVVAMKDIDPTHRPPAPRPAPTQVVVQEPPPRRKVTTR